MQYSGYLFVVFAVLVVVAVAQPADWKLRILQGNLAFTPTLPQDKRYFPALGNGNLGTTVYDPWVYQQGVYVSNGVLAVASTRAAIPSPLLVALASSATFVGAASDFERGVYLQRYEAANITVEQRWYAHQSRSELLVHEVEVTNRSPQPFVVVFHQTPLTTSTDIKFTSASCGSIRNCVAYQGQVVKAEVPSVPAPRLAFAYLNVNNQNLTVAPNSKGLKVVLMTSFTNANGDPSDLLGSALSSLSAAMQSPGTLFSEHIAAWAQLWANGGVEVTGDLTLATNINASLYALYSSVRADLPWPPAPGGLTPGYYGNIFWDNELWMFPVFTTLQPALALASTNYRLARIPAAQQYAKSTGYQGSRFPWQSAASGFEVDFVPWINRMEQHISGDIGVALRNYYYATKNNQWLATIGWPIISGIADFWSSRAKLNAQTGHYDIIGVVPPDEFALGITVLGGVTNSVYTNYGAKLSIEFALEAARLLQKAPPALWAQVSAKLAIPFEQKPIPHHPEYDGFPTGNFWFGEYVKQADVSMLQFPYDLNLTDALRESDMVFYEKYMDPTGPAMTYAINTINWLYLRNATMATEALIKTQANIQKPFAVWTETPDPDDHAWDLGIFNFITGAGGFIQTLLHGYGGMRFRDSGLVFKLALPAKVTELKLRGVNYQERMFDVWWNATGSYFALRNGQAGPLTIQDLSNPSRKQLLSSQSPFVSFTSPIATSLVMY